MEISRSVTLISGASESAKAHSLALEEDGKTGVLNTWCGIKLNIYTAQCETADKFTFEQHQPCRKCQKTWPDISSVLFDKEEQVQKQMDKGPGNQNPDNFSNIDDALR